MRRLVGPAIRNANRGGSHKSIRTNGVTENKKKNYFHSVRAIRANRLKPAIRNFKPPRGAIRKKVVQFGNPETIPKGPNLEKNQDRLKFSISLENFNLA